MNRRIATAAVAASMLAVLVGAAPAGAAPTASKADESLVTYLSKGKLKLGKRISYNFVCSVNCNVKIDVTVVLPGPNFTPAPISGSLAAGAITSDTLKPNGPLLKSIKAFKSKAKLRTKITATDVATGVVDIDKRTFKFK